MANVYTSLADLVKINDQNLADIVVSDLLDDAPLLRALAADIASNGTEHKYLKQTGAPTTAFRAANDGRENKASADTLVTVTLKIFDASYACDMALANSYYKGKDAYLNREGMRHIRSAFQTMEKQIFYGAGTGGDSAGFTGLTDNAAFDAVADTLVVDATGSTASTGASCWLIRTQLDAVCLVAGQDGNLELGETTVQRLAGATGYYPAYWTPVTGYYGLQLGNAYPAVRICNLTAQTGKGLTDILLSTAIAKFPATAPPNLIVMSRRSLMQLQKSRTATSPTGAPAPFPDSAFNIPIVVTDQLSETEAIVT